MKHSFSTAFFATVCLLTVTSCSGKDDKAQAAVKAWLESTLGGAGGYESVEFGPLEGGPDIYTMNHTYKERGASGESTTKQVTFCLTASCLHARPSGEPTEDLEWAIKWSHAEDR